MEFGSLLAVEVMPTSTLLNACRLMCFLMKCYCSLIGVDRLHCISYVCHFYQCNAVLRLVCPPARSFSRLRHVCKSINKKLKQARPVHCNFSVQGMPLRTHYFYPLVLAQGSNEQGIYDIIKEMVDLGVDANYDLLAEYVFPAVNTEDAATVVEKLKVVAHFCTELP